MKIEINNLQADRAAGLDGEGGAAEVPTSAAVAGPTAGNTHAATRAVDVAAGPSKGERRARALERRITWESLLLGGMAVVFAVLGVMAMLEVAAFGARFDV